MNIPTYTSGLLQGKAYRTLHGKVSSALAAFSLSLPEWTIIGFLYERKTGAQFSEIAIHLNVEPPHITLLVEELEKKRMVQLQKHPTDKRSKIVLLTKTARSQTPKIEKTVRDVLSSLLQGVTQRDLESYQKVLEAIIRNSST